MGHSLHMNRSYARMGQITNMRMDDRGALRGCRQATPLLQEHANPKIESDIENFHFSIPNFGHEDRDNW